MILAFVAMAVLPILLVAVFSYFVAQNTLHERVYAQLNGVLDLKQAEVSRWISSASADSMLLADNYVNEEHLTVILNPATSPLMRERYQFYLTEYLHSLLEARPGYSEIFYVTPDGKVLLSTNSSRVGDDLSKEEIVSRTLSSHGGVVIQDMTTVGGHTEMAFGHVMHRVELGPMITTDVINAAVVIRVELESSFYPTWLSWPASRQTGELHIYAQRDGQWVYASPLRFSNDSPLSRALPSNLQSLLGSGSNFQPIWWTKDYRGVDVLLGARSIPETGWILAVQQSQAEALGPIIELRNVWLAVTIIVLIAALLVAPWLGRSLTDPLQELTQAAQKVQAGNMKTTVSLDRSDEFGELAAAFNSMIASVGAQASRIEERSQELQALVNLSDDFLSSMDVRKTLDSALREALASTQAEKAAAFLMLDDENTFETMAQINMPDELMHVRYPLDAHSAPGYTMLQRKVVTTPDVSRETRYSIPPAVLKLGITSNLSAPMLIDGRTIGALTVVTTKIHEFTSAEIGMLQAISNHTAVALERVKLVSDRSEMYDRTLTALVAALDARDRETEGHSKRVVAYTQALAEKMGVPSELRQEIARGAMLHDIGKIGVPDSILHKTGPLGDGEWAIVRKHPEWGKQILEGIRFLEGPAQMVLTHHERWDGSGYPLGLKSEQIPLGSRIFAVVDAFDAMTSYRPYRNPESYAKARTEIRDGRGTQFDPDVVDAFLKVSKEEWVQLRESQGSRPMQMGSLRRIGSGQLQAMNVIVAAITSSLEIQEVMAHTAHTLVDVTRARAAAIYLFDGDEVRFSAGANLPEELQNSANELQDLFDKDLIREGKAEFHEDILTEKGSLSQRIRQLRPNWKSMVCVPLQEADRVAGALLLFSDAPYVFDEEDQLMFSQVGKQLGQALVNTRLHEKVRVQAITDGLTGAYNRRYLDDFLNIEVKRCQRYQRPMAILLLDMDYFHACNEKSGHQAGDRALRDVVQLLNLGVRSVDLVARYGGEEFMVVLPETEAEGAMEVAERIRRLVEKHRFPCGALTASIGVTASPFHENDSLSVEELVGQADKALYRAKEDGRNRVRLWDPGMVQRREK
jgi:diguanylate cyclase (GGDEF)-like protein